MKAKIAETYKWMPHTKLVGITIGELPGMITVDKNNLDKSTEEAVERYCNNLRNELIILIKKTVNS